MKATMEHLGGQPAGASVLVSGGAGFIGSHLTDELVRRGIRVRILDNFDTGSRDWVNPCAELVEADLRSAAAIKPICVGIDCVFHLAARPRVLFSIEHPLESHVTNVVGTLNLLIAARAAGVRRFVFSGSSAVYGNQPELPLRESMTPNPLNPYALQKLTAEQYTRLFHHLYSMETLTLRYFNVYGPRMAITGAYATVIGVFLDQRRRGQALTIHGDGTQTRDFTHVRDVVRANLLAMNCAVADGRAVNVGRGRNLSINQIAHLIGGPTVQVERRAGDARDTLADITQAREVLGWRPEIGIEDGIRELIPTVPDIRPA